MLLRVLFLSCFLVTIICLVEVQGRQNRIGIRKQIYCKKCQNALKDLQNNEPKIDEAELLDNLLTICETGSSHPVLQNKIKVQLMICSVNFNIVYWTCRIAVRDVQLFKSLHFSGIMRRFQRELSTTFQF